MPTRISVVDAHNWLQFLHQWAHHKGKTAAAVCITQGGKVYGAHSLYQEGATYNKSCISMLLSNLTMSEIDGLVLISNQPPSDWCNGIMTLYGVDCLYHPSKTGKIREIRFTRDRRSISDSINLVLTKPGANCPNPPMAITTEYTAMAPHQDFPLPPDLQQLPLGQKFRSTKNVHQFFSHLALDLVSVAMGSRGTEHRGKNIGAVITDDKGVILGWGINTNNNAKWRHAEVNAIRSITRRLKGVPPHMNIYTTLEPCEMCSGMITNLAANGATINVYYLAQDPKVTCSALKTSARNCTAQLSPAEMALDQTGKRVEGEKPYAIWRQLNRLLQDYQNPRITAFFEEATFRQLAERAKVHWFHLVAKELQAAATATHHMIRVLEQYQQTSQTAFIEANAQMSGQILHQAHQPAQAQAALHLYFQAQQAAHQTLVASVFETEQNKLQLNGAAPARQAAPSQPLPIESFRKAEQEWRQYNLELERYWQIFGKLRDLVPTVLNPPRR